MSRQPMISFNDFETLINCFLNSPTCPPDRISSAAEQCVEYKTTMSKSHVLAYILQKMEPLEENNKIFIRLRALCKYLLDYHAQHFFGEINTAAKDIPACTGKTPYGMAATGGRKMNSIYECMNTLFLRQTAQSEKDVLSRQVSRLEAENAELKAENARLLRCSEPNTKLSLGSRLAMWRNPPPSQSTQTEHTSLLMRIPLPPENASS